MRATADAPPKREVFWQSSKAASALYRMYSMRGPQESRQMLLNADVMPEATKRRSSGGMLPSKFKAMGKSRSDGLK